jgi:hypothetical protein
VRAPVQNAPRAIAFILAGMLCISVNDMLIKVLSGGYPLHQMVFVRAAIGICASLVFLRLEGGCGCSGPTSVLHASARGRIVLANMLFFRRCRRCRWARPRRCSSSRRSSSRSWRSRFWGNPWAGSAWRR